MPLRASNTYAITVLFSILMIPSCFITFHKYVKIIYLSHILLLAISKNL